MLGLFDFEIEPGHKHTYDKFVTQGAKKYAYELDNKISITVAGVPKKGANALHNLKDFKDDFIFDYKDTGKQLIVYVDNEEEFNLTDYNGVEYKVTDKSGVCFIPTTYVLGKALDYANLISDNSSNRSIYIEDGDL